MKKIVLMLVGAFGLLLGAAGILVGGVGCGGGAPGAGDESEEIGQAQEASSTPVANCEVQGGVQTGYCATTKNMNRCLRPYVPAVCIVGLAATAISDISHCLPHDTNRCY